MNQESVDLENLKKGVDKGTTDHSQMELSTRPSIWQLFGSGFVLSACSPSFYYHAARRWLLTAVAFFILFGLVLAGVQTWRIANNMQSLRDDISAAFDDGKVPELTIANGEAVVHGPEPFVVVDDGINLVVFDTTGAYTGAELNSYDSGLILTKTKLYSIDDQGDVQVAPLDMPFLSQSTIEINEALAQRAVSAAQLLVFMGLAFWRVVMGIVYITSIAFVVWGVAALAQRNISFSTVLTTGMYAVVPATYANYLLDRVAFDFFGMFTLLLLIGWAISLVAAAGERRSGDFLRGKRPLRAWRALLGIPMLALLALDSVYQWTNGAIIVWVAAAITYIALFGIEFMASQAEMQRDDSAKIALQK
jgi:hypothetical protein